MVLLTPSVYLQWDKIETGRHFTPSTVIVYIGDIGVLLGKKYIGCCVGDIKLTVTPQIGYTPSSLNLDAYFFAADIYIYIYTYIYIQIYIYMYLRSHH